MAVFLLKIIFLAISTLSNFITRLFFTTIANLLIVLIHAFKVPGESMQGVLEQVGEAIKGCLEYFLELLIEVIKTIISSVFDALINGVTGSAAVTGSAIGGLVEKTRTSFEGLLNDFPEIIEGFSEMISTVVTDLWNNYKDALGYVTENA
ncbi:Anti-sigma-I factor RsgI6 like [Fagus crenata]